MYAISATFIALKNILTLQKKRMSSEERKLTTEPNEWYVCLFASARQNSMALTEMKHESPGAFALLRTKTTRDNRTEIKITANPLGLLKTMENCAENGLDVVRETVKGLACFIGPISDLKVAKEIKKSWENESRGLNPRCVTGNLLGQQYGVPVSIDWHAFYQINRNEVTIIEHVDKNNSVVKLSYLVDQDM